MEREKLKIEKDAEKVTFKNLNLRYKTLAHLNLKLEIILNLFLNSNFKIKNQSKRGFIKKDQKS